MTKILKNLSGGQEPTFTKTIRNLENLTGNKSIDIELTADIITQLNLKIEKLGLDPSDTTPTELQAAIRQKFLKLDKSLKKNFNQNFNQIIDYANQSSLIVPIPSFNRIVIKDIIHKLPPKNVMKKLGCRSMTSMLKRFPVEQILIGCMLHESINWHRNFSKALKKLKTTDITMSKPKVVMMDERLTKDYPLGNSLPYIQFLGTVGVNPHNLKSGAGFAITLAILAKDLHYIHQRGVYAKLLRFSKKVSRYLVNLTYAKLAPIEKVIGIDISWYAIYRYVSNSIHHAAFNEPVIDASDFKWQRSSQIIDKITKKINPWTDCEFLGKFNETCPISLNINDIAYDILNNVSYGNGSVSSLNKHVNEELLSRYLQNWQDTETLIHKLGITS